MPTHAVIWMNHTEAHVFHVHPGTADETTIVAPQHLVHRHSQGRGEARDHPDDARRYFQEVAAGLRDTTALLILGPSSAKFEFFRHLQEHDRARAATVVGIETADHPTDGQVVARARVYFTHSDRLG